jgi:TRAP-type mannitol/chloroaromatic compound transport system permease small subunit
MTSSNIHHYIEVVNRVTEYIGRAASFLFVPLMFITALEVCFRYLFNSPTIWAWDVNIQLFGITVVAGGSYAYLHNSHVRVDVFVNLLSRRTQLLLEVATSALFFFLIGILLWQSIIEATFSVKARELYNSVLQPPIYPLKMLIPVFVFLILLQGIVKVILSVLELIELKKVKVQA